MKILLVLLAACSTPSARLAESPPAAVSEPAQHWWCFDEGSCTRDRADCLTARAKLEVSAGDAIRDRGKPLGECTVADHAFCSRVSDRDRHGAAMDVDLCTMTMENCMATLAVALQDVSHTQLDECRAKE